MKRLFILTTLLLFATITQAQDTTCTLDLTSIQAQLTHAQEMADGGDLDGALADLALAKANLELVEAGCIDRVAEDVGSGRSNPVPLGQWQDFESFGEPLGAARVVNYVDDATQLVLETDNSNVPPAEGMRYVLIEYEMMCKKLNDEICDFSSTVAKAVGSRGLMYDFSLNSNRSFTVIENFFPGTTVTYKAVIEVGADETDILFVPGYGEWLYFSTQ